MTDRRHVSPFQFTQQPDGSMGLANLPKMKLVTIDAQGAVVGRDWQTELGLPTYYEEWEEMGRIRTDQRRGRLTFVLMDESQTQLTGQPRLQPKQIVLATQCHLELGHSGFVIGAVTGYVLGIGAPLPPWFNLIVPSGLEGDLVIGHATLFDSPLAEKAQEGLTRGIFTHVCPVLWTPDGATVGTGGLVQVSLVPGDYPGCPNARVLEWEA